MSASPAKTALASNRTRAWLTGKRKPAAPLWVVLLAAALAASGGAAGGAAAASPGPHPMNARQTSGEAAARHTLRPLGFALLPLEAPAGSNQQALADGLTAYLTSDLSKIRGSFVIARASAAALQPGDARPQAAAARFGVRYVVSGTAGEESGRLQVEAALFDAAAGKQLWSHAFARDAAELAGLRGDVLARIAQSVGAPLSDAALHHEGRIPGDLLLRAKALLVGPQSATTMAEARRLLERVLSADGRPGDAAEAMPEALTELASIHLAEALSGRSPAPAQDLRRAEQLVARALAADPHDGRGLALKGALLRVLQKPREALAAYQAAVAADDNLADAHAEIGRVRIDLGEAAEALPPIEQALARSPLDPQTPLWLSFAAMAELYAGRPAAAIPWAERAAALAPNFLNPQIWLAAAHQLSGDSRRAAADRKRAQALSPGLTVARLARHLAAADPRVTAQASRVLEALRRAGLPE
jgi:adenylate cyclase